MKQATQSQSKQNGLTGSINPFTLQEQYADVKARYKAHVADVAPHIRAEYGDVADEDIWRIELAEAELAICRDCKGDCRKETNKYSVPTIYVFQGRVDIHNEICRYEVQRRYKQSQLPLKYADKTFEDYEVTSDNAEAVKIASAYAKKKPAASLYFYGGAGTGKTFLSTLIAQEFLRNGYSVEFGDVPSLLGRIKKTFGTTENGGEILDRYKNCDLLILDDLGVGKITDWNADILYQIINERYNDERRLIVTSNYDLKGLTQRLKLDGDDFIARRITSRLAECVQAFFGTKDRRV